MYNDYNGGARLEVQYNETPTIAQICMRRETVEGIANSTMKYVRHEKSFICKQTTNGKGENNTMLKATLSQTVTKRKI